MIKRMNKEAAQVQAQYASSRRATLRQKIRHEVNIGADSNKLDNGRRDRQSLT
jgi:hypothetical protein